MLTSNIEKLSEKLSRFDQSKINDRALPKMIEKIAIDES
jgi:hypothetical protein